MGFEEHRYVVCPVSNAESDLRLFTVLDQSDNLGFFFGGDSAGDDGIAGLSDLQEDLLLLQDASKSRGFYDDSSLDV